MKYATNICRDMKMAIKQLLIPKTWMAVLSSYKYFLTPRQSIIDKNLNPGGR